MRVFSTVVAFSRIGDVSPTIEDHPYLDSDCDESTI